MVLATTSRPNTEVITSQANSILGKTTPTEDSRRNI